MDGWPDWISTWIWVLAPIGVGIGLWAGLRLAGAGRRWRRRRASHHGRRMESKAPAALARRGYRVIERHPALTVTWFVDDTPRELTLEPDLLVARGGRRFLVEVKTGGSARPESRDTRRQLLEYAAYFRADGVLLYDADQDALRAVEFPLPRARPRWPAVLFGAVIGAVVGALATFSWLAG